MSDAATYLLAHFAKSQLWHSSTMLFGFFLTEACGMDPTTMGVVMALSLLVNGLMDGLIGRQVGDKGHGLATGLRRQGLFACTTCLFFMGFCATQLLDPSDRLLWAIATILAFRVSYAMVDVPQNAAVSLVAADFDARCVLLARRNIASGLANLAVGTIAGGLLIHGHATGLWLVWAASVAILTCVTASRLQRLAPLPSLTPVAGSPIGEVVDPIGQARTSWGAALASLAVLMLACSTFRSLEPYYAAFVAKGVGILAWAAVGSMVSQPLWVACRRRMGMAATLAIIASLLLFTALMLMGPWRAERLGAVLIGTGFGAGSSGLWLMLWTTMLAGAGTEHAMTRAGVFTCMSKLAQGAAMLLLGHVMASSPYRKTLADAWSGPSLLMAGGLAAMAGASLILLFAQATGRQRLSRAACGGTSGRPPPMGPTIRAPGWRSP